MNPSTAHARSTPEHLAAPSSDVAILLTTETVADFLACSPRNVTRLITAGHLPATRLGPGKSSWRVTETDLLAFTQRWGHHSPADVADSLDPDRLPTPAPPLGLLTTRRTAEGLQMIELQHPDPDPDGMLLVRPAPSPGQG